MTSSSRPFLPAALLFLAAVASQSAVAASMPAGTYRRVSLTGPARIHISAIKSGSINVYDQFGTLMDTLAKADDFIKVPKGSYFLGLVRGGPAGASGYEFDMDVSQSSPTVNYSFHAVSKLSGDKISISNEQKAPGVTGKIDPSSIFTADGKGGGSGKGAFLLVSFD